jgi:hypothetical protein
MGNKKDNIKTSGKTVAPVPILKTLKKAIKNTNTKRIYGKKVT